MEMQVLHLAAPYKQAVRLLLKQLGEEYKQAVRLLLKQSGAEYVHWKVLNSYGEASERT
jgi:hypothetical protein